MEEIALNPVILGIDAGHVGSELDNSGQVGDNSRCKRCDQPWPCSVMQEARQRQRRLHGVKEVK